MTVAPRRLWKWLAFGTLAALAALVMAGYFAAGIRVAVKSDSSLSDIRLPPGFRISVFADGLGGSALSTPGPNPGPRMMLLKDGVLYVTIPSQGKVVALFDSDRDGRAERRTTVVEGLRQPHGIDFAEERATEARPLATGSQGGWFYIAEETRVVKFRDADGDSVADPGSLQTVVDGLPGGGGHFTRTLKVRNSAGENASVEGGSGGLYISAGSSCNVCIESDPWRAAITRCNLDGTNCTPFARGLRNSVGFVFRPGSGKIYATENGRDWLGDDAPPDELNRIEAGKDYGWPICYGKGVHDTDFDKKLYEQDPCESRVRSLVDLQAHSAPLGLAFYDGAQFPAAYQGNLFVAFHGSWNRGQPTGYKMVRVNMTTLQVSDFATGWLQGSNVLGRPVDIVVDVDGGLLVSDDNAGKIYRIAYRAR